MDWTIQVKNFKSLVDSNEMKFTPGVNTVVGKNSSGKSAILSAIQMAFHSVLGSPIHDSSSYRRYGQPFEIILTFPMTPELQSTLVSDNSNIHLGRVKMIFNDSGYFKVHIQTENSVWTPVLYPKFPNASRTAITLAKLSFRNGARAEQTGATHSIQTPAADGLPSRFWADGFYAPIVKALRQGLQHPILVPAFREIPSQNNLASESQLSPNGGNIHNVLLTLISQHDPRMIKLEDFLSSIFPQYHEISVTPGKNGQDNYSQINLRDTATGQLIPLAQCGAGVAQIILLASLVILNDQPKIFLMDEPHSFLHPEAERKLLSFLEANGHHTYIIATHSITTINSVKAGRVTLVHSTPDGGTTSHLLSENGSLDEICKTIGVTNADLALANKIIFVEGDTEQKVISHLLHLCGYDLEELNIAVVNAVGTGNIQHFRKMHTNYRDVIKITVPHKFLKDRDEQEPDGSEPDVIYLNVRELENYFLNNPSAILKAITTDTHVQNLLNDEPDSDFSRNIRNLTPEVISGMIQTRLESNEFLLRDLNPHEEAWMVVKASALLTSLFRELGLRSYDKVLHGEIIAYALEPSDVKALGSVVEDFFLEPEPESKRAQLIQTLLNAGISVEEAKRLLI